MERKMKKILIALLSFIFIVNPFLQIKMNVGTVNAAGEWESVILHAQLDQYGNTIYREEIDNVANGRKYKLASIEIQYTIYYHTFVILYDVTLPEEKYLMNSENMKKLGLKVYNMKHGEKYIAKNPSIVTYRYVTFEVDSRNPEITNWYSNKTSSTDVLKKYKKFIELPSTNRVINLDMQAERRFAYHYMIYNPPAPKKNNSGGSSNYSNNSPVAQEIIQDSYDNYDYSYDNWEPDYTYFEAEPAPAPVVTEKNIPISDDNKRLYIKTLYRTVLGREASDDDVNAHFGNSVQRIAIDIILSDESKNRNSLDSLSNSDFVKKMYNFLLQRDADANGLSHYTGDLNYGVGRDTFIKSIVESVEFGKLLNNLDREIAIADASRIIYYGSLYRNVIGRDPNQDDIDYNLTTTVQRNTHDVIFSPESVNKNRIYTSSNKDFATFLYKVILGRDPDPEGLKANTNYLNMGNTRQNLAKNFVESEEFSNHRLRECKTINLDEQLRNAVYANLISQGFEAGKTGSNSLIMYKDDFDRVTSLDLSGKELKNIDGLSLFTNLEKLILQNNKLEDINELTRMTNLKYLNINGCGLKNNITVVNSLINLEELHIDNNEVTTYYLNKSISNCSKLQKLYINNNALVSVDSALELDSIKEIYADNNNISNFNIGNKKLDVLSLKNQQILVSGFGNEKDLPEVAKLAQDKNNVLYAPNGFDLEHCSIKNDKIIMNDKKGKITIKGGVTDGTVISLKDSELAIVINDKVLADRLQKKLGSFCKARNDMNGHYFLYVDKNYTDSVINLDLSAKENDKGEIKDITGIENFINLKTLNLNSNKVNNLSLLSKLNKLETLSIRFNGLNSLDSVKNLTNLVQLDASNNSITDTKEVASLTNLNTLLLSNNNIGNNLDGIKSLNRLSTLAIANNGVSDIKPIAGLDIDSYYASLNNIANSSLLTSKENVNIVDLKNNTIDINVNGKTADIPDIIKYATKDNGTNNLEFVNCKIENDKIVLDSGAKKAQIKIKEGNASDTVVNIRNTEAQKAFDVDIKYTKNADKSVTATITSETPIRYISGWGHSPKKTEYKNVYYYNTKENITIESIYGDEIVKTIEIKDVESSKIDGLNVVYDNYDMTNGTVTITITANEAMYLPPQWIGDGITKWRMSDDQKTITKVFEVNGNGSIDIISQENHDKIVELTNKYNNNEITKDEYDDRLFELKELTVHVDRNVATIDTEAPKCNVEYSTTEKTKGSVRAIIWSDEEIELVDKTSKMYSDVSATDENEKTKYGISLYYPENIEESIEVRDIAGNTTNVEIKINNIDTYVDGLAVNTRGMTATNGNETIDVKANESINVSNNNAVTAKVKQLYRSALEPLFTVAGSLSATPIMTGDLNAVGDMPNMFLSDTNSSLITRIAENNVISNEDGNEISMEVSEGMDGVIEATDISNNTDVAPYNTKNIDKECPNIQRVDTINDDGSITVKLIVNEEIQDTEDLAGWTLSDDKTSLIKTFKFNETENVVVKDLAGNETEYDVIINNIFSINYKVYYEKIENSNKYLVVIKADRDLAEVDGWRHLENKNEIAKVLTLGEKETLIINGIDDGSSVVYIEVFDEEIDNVEDEKTEENNVTPVDDKDKKDTTQSGKALPQTGKFVAATAALGITVAIVINRKNKYNKYKIR